VVSRVAYGTQLDSEVPLEGLPAPAGDELGIVQVSLHEELHRPGARDLGPPDVEAEVSGKPLSFRVNGTLDIRWGSAASFRLTPGEPRIHCSRGADGTLRQVEEWLLQYALPLHLQMERHLIFLHAGAVRIGGEAVGFLAPSGGGKSTLVHHFVAQGHTFLSDDKLGCVHRSGRTLAVPATPFYRLGVTWERADRFVPTAQPLRALFVLVPAAADAPAEVTPLSPTEAAFALAHRCELQLPSIVRERLGLAPLAVERFQDCARLATGVPVRRLVVPRHHARLPDVHRAVRADLGNLE
jgi:hypothetical protein